MSVAPVLPSNIDQGSFSPRRVKKAILIAISTIFLVGMILSYVLGGPWLLTAGFFALCLAPLFPLGKPANTQVGRIAEPSSGIVHN